MVKEPSDICELLIEFNDDISTDLPLDDALSSQSKIGQFGKSIFGIETIEINQLIEKSAFHAQRYFIYQLIKSKRGVAHCENIGICVTQTVYH